jgi:chromosome segregation ATPase
MSEPSKDPAAVSVLSLLLSGGGLALAKILAAPLIQDWVEARRQRRETLAKREQEEADRKERAYNLLSHRVTALEEEVRECRADAREARDLAERERGAKEAAEESAEAFRREHEHCQERLSALTLTVDELRREVANLRRQLPA